MGDADKDRHIEKFRDLIKVQCSNGNWNYDPYMHGLANGMIMSLAMLEGVEPVFLNAPDVWLKDVERIHALTVAENAVN